MNQNLKYLIDFIVKMDYDKGTADKVAVEISKVLEGKLPKNLISPEALTNAVEGLKQIEASGVDLSSVFEDMMSSFDDTALQDFALEFGSMMEDIENVDLSALDGMLESLSPDQIEAFGTAMQDSFANIDVSNLSESFNQINANLAHLKEGGAKAGKETGEGIAHGIGGAAPKAGQEGKHVGDSAKHGLMGSMKELPSMMLAMFGGSMLTQGFMGITQGIESIFEAGKQLHENLERMELGFTAAGLAGEGLEKQMQETGDFAGYLSQEFGVSATSIREYSAQAALLGGSTGKMNEDITKLAVGLTKASGGLVDASMVIRVFSRGIMDEEAEANLGRLKMTFPALATALKGVKEPAELTRVAMEKMGPMFKLMTEQAQRPVGAMERFENALEGMKKTVGLTLVEALSPLIDFLGTEVVPAVLGVSKGIKETSHWIEEHKEILLAIATPLALITAAYVYQNTVLGFSAYAKMREAAAWVTSTAIKIKAYLAEKLAIEGTTIAQKALNLVMSANPYIAVVAGIIALISAFKLISDAIHVTAKERLSENKALKENNEHLIESKKKEAEAIESKKRMVEGLIKTGKETSELTKKVKEYEIGLGNIKKEILDLETKKIDIELNIKTLETDVKIEELQEKLAGIFHPSSWAGPLQMLSSTYWKALIGMTAEGDVIAEEFMKNFTDGLKKAKNSTDIDKAVADIQEKIILNKGISEEAKLQMYNLTAEISKAKRAELEQNKKALVEEYELFIKNGKGEEKSIELVASKHKLTKEKVQEVIKAEEESKKIIGSTIIETEKLAQGWQQVGNNIKKAYTDSLAAYQMMLFQSKKQQATFTKEQWDEAGKNLQKTKDDQLEFDKFIKEFQKNNSWAIIEQAKSGKSALENMQDLFNRKKDMLEIENSIFELDLKNNANAEKRKLDEIDEMAIATQRLKSQEDELKYFNEIFKKMINKPEVQKQLIELKNAIADSKANILELQATVSPDALKALQDELSMKRLEFELEIGLDPKSTTEKMVSLVQEQVADLKSKLDKTTDEKTKIELSTKILELEKRMGEIIKSGSEKIIADIKEKSDKEIELTTQKYDKLIEIAKQFNEMYKQTRSNVFDDESKRELEALQKTQEDRTKILDKQKEYELLSEAEYQFKKQQLDEKFAAEKVNKEKEIADKKAAQENLIAGMELEAQREKDVSILSIQKAAQEKELKELQSRLALKKSMLGFVSAEEEKQLKTLSESFTKTSDELATKSDTLFQFVDQMGMSISDTLAQALAGDPDALKDNAKKYFETVTGILSKQLEAFILGLLLNESTITWITSTFGIFSPVAILLAKNIISSMVHKIADPILNSIASFATGGDITGYGRYDSPTQITVGDASKRGGINREWVTRDENIKQIVQMAVNISNNALLNELRNLNQILSGQELGVDINLDKLHFGLKRAAYFRSQRTQ